MIVDVVSDGRHAGHRPPDNVASDGLADGDRATVGVGAAVRDTSGVRDASGVRRTHSGNTVGSGLTVQFNVAIT